MSLCTYKKRAGTSDRGREYEWLLCAFYSLNFSVSPNVIDFELFTNNEFFGDFDDITLRVKFSNGAIKVFLFQLKHSEKTKSFALNSLTSPTGDFSLAKYLKSYQNSVTSKNFNYILYVNKTANFKDQTKLTWDSQEVYIRRHGCVGETLLDTNRGRNCSVYKFEGHDTSGFFGRFFLYANQQNDTYLKQSIGAILKTNLHCDIYTTFIEFMRSWWAGNFKLTKRDVVSKLAELVFSPMILPVSGEDSNERTSLIEAAILKFDLTLIDTRIGNIWSRAVVNDLKRASMTALKFGLTTTGIRRVEDLAEEKKARVLWFMDELPLVVEVDHAKKEQVDAIFGLLGRCNKKKRVVLIGYDVNFVTWRTLRTLADLEKSDFERISKSFTLSLQGKKTIKLQEINSSVLGVAALVEIANSDTFTVGEPLENLPPCYIERSFTKIMLNWGVINDLNKSKILLSCNGHLESVQNKFNKQPVDISVANRRLNFFKYNMFVTNQEFPEEVVAQELNTEHPSHHFRVVEQSLQWLTSSGKIEELEPYKKSGDVIKEDEVEDHFRNKIKVVTSHPGTGKTTLFNSLKNNAPRDCFVVKMTLKDHAELFNEDQDAWRYIVDFTAKTRGYKGFETQLLWHFPKRRVIILWDSLEELDIDLITSFVNTVLTLRDGGVSQWISAHNNFRKFLEINLGVFAMNLLPFTQEEQRQYMQCRCGVTTTHFFENITIVDDQEYLGVPLQLHILTDIFFKDPKLLDTIYTLTDMFAAFIEGRYKHYLSGKSTGSFSRLSSLIEDAKTHRMEQYKIAAVKTHLPSLYHQLHLRSSDRFVEDVKNGDFLGLLRLHGDEFQFEHRITGEFFCASFLAENPPRGLHDFIFEEDCRNIRFMFDLLSSNDPTFVALLYKKFDSIGVGLKDKHGRSPLHVLCSYGVKHPRLPTEDRGDKFVIKTARLRGVREDDQDLQDVVKRLGKLYDPYEEDTFGSNCFDYADRSFSLGLLECLNYKKQELLNYSHASLLYYAIRMNYSAIFAGVQHFPFVEDSSGCNLLHVATKFNRGEFLTRLLSLDNHKVFINKPNGDNWTPLHIATFNGNFELVKFLVRKGAAFVLREPSVMSLAVVRGRKDLVEFFLECGCSPNEFYHTNHFTTSIFQAIDRKHEKIVELLLDNGAKLYCVNRITPDDEKPNPFGMNLFHMLLENQQFEEADIVLQKGIHINSVDNEGRTAFHHAALNDLEAVLKYLLARGGDCKIVDNSRRSPLHSAAHSGSLGVGKMLIDHGVDVEAQDNNGLTPLHTALMAGEDKFVCFLLKEGVNPNVVNKYRRTPLHLAAIYDLTSSIQVLQEFGADLEAKDGLYERTPLHLAAWNGNSDCVKLLLELGAFFDASCHFGYTPLHLAVQEAHTSSCKLLLEAGASVNVKNVNDRTPLSLLKKGCSSLGRLLAAFDPTPLHTAVARKDVVFIEEQLLDHCDVNGRDGAGNTPLHIAATCPTPSQIIKILLAHGGDVTAKNSKGLTPLHVGIQSGYRDADVVELLLGDDVNEATGKGDTPLILACQMQWCQLVTTLMQRGARSEERDAVGLTALHYAASFGITEIVSLLVERDHVVNRGTNSNRTPLHLAASRGHLNVVKLLLSCGASPIVVDADGDTPLDDALKAEQPHIFEVLRRHHVEYDIATTYLGRSILHAAAKSGALDMVKLFMETLPVDATHAEEALFNRHFKVFEFLAGKVSFDLNKKSWRYGKYPLHVVTSAGSTLVQSFLKKGAKVDLVDDEGNTPLHNSIENGHHPNFLQLLSYGRGALNMKNRKGYTPLHLAVKLNMKDKMAALLNAGADPDVVDDDGHTPLDLALKEGSFYKPLLFKTKNFDVNKRYHFQQTILHFAVSGGCVKVIPTLAEKGMSINCGDARGNTPLHYATGLEPEILTTLLEVFKSSIDIDMKNGDGKTALHVAAEVSLPNVTKLLEFGASPYATSKYGATPLFYALKNPKCFTHLWRKTPELKVFNMAGHMTKTILHQAAYDGDIESVKFLLGVGLKINEADNNGDTPLKNAAVEGHLEVLKVLLREDKKHMVVNIFDKHGRSLLHLMAHHGSLESVKLLVECRARRDLYDQKGRTAAQLASSKTIAKFLSK